NLPETFDPDDFETTDDLPITFTGLLADGGQTTPALDTGASTASRDITDPISVDATDDEAETKPTPTVVVERSTEPSHGSQDLQILITLTGTAFEVNMFGSCAGSGMYREVFSGAPILVRDSTGRVVAQSGPLFG